jgi:hypothetical protein
MIVRAGGSGHGSLAKMQPKVAETRLSHTGGSVEPCLGHLPIPSLQGVKASLVDKSVAKASCSPPPSDEKKDEKKDKRQWALELLARKSGATASSSAKGIKKESSLLVQILNCVTWSMSRICLVYPTVLEFW